MSVNRALTESEYEEFLRHCAADSIEDLKREILLQREEIARLLTIIDDQSAAILKLMEELETDG